MTTLQTEALIAFGEAAKRLPRRNGKRPHTSTLWRWARVGLNGVRLEYVRVGGRLYTTADALDRFIGAVSEAADATAVDIDPPEPVNDRVARAERRCEELGV